MNMPKAHTRGAIRIDDVVKIYDPNGNEPGTMT